MLRRTKLGRNQQDVEKGRLEQTHHVEQKNKGKSHLLVSVIPILLFRCNRILRRLLINQKSLKWLSMELNVLLEFSQAILSQENGEGKISNTLYLRMSFVTSSCCFILSLFESSVHRSHKKERKQLSGKYWLFFGIFSSMLQFIINFVALVRNKITVKFDPFPLLLSLGYSITAMVDPSEKSIDMSQMQGKFSFFSLLRPWLIRLSVQLNLLIGLSQAVLTQQNGQRKLGTQIFLKMSLFTSLGSLILSLVEFILKRKRMQRKVVWLKRGFIWQEQVSGTFSLYFGIVSSTIQFVINFVAVMVNKNVVQFNTVSLLLSISYLITEMIAPGEIIVIGRIQGNFPFFSLSISSDSSILINEFQQILSHSSVPLKAGLNSKSFKGEVCQNSSPKMLVHLIEPDMISDIQQIVHLLTDAGYRNQCWDVYRSCRMDALKSCLGVLGLRFHFFGGTDWRNLVDAKKWIEAFRIMVKVLLLEEKRLCKEIFDGSGLSNPWSWEIGGLCLYQLLRYGEDATFCRKQHLKELPRDQLLIILKMYEALRDTLPYLEGLLSIGSGEFVCSQAKRLLDKLGKAANRTLTEFENVVKNEDSKNNLVPTGMEIHPHGNDVMNYVKSLVKGHGQTLNSLLGSYEVGEITPLGCRLIPLIFSLEFNLKKVAEFYKDKALQYIFLMNNKHYIVQEVMCSVLGNHLGDDWIHKHHTKIHTYAKKYLKASWSKVLSCLIRDENIGDSSSETFKMTLKERFTNFNTNFEEIYKTQTTWKILDPQLRTEVQTSISKKVIPAYRSFLDKFGSQLESEEDVWKYIKYTPEDLEWYLADLFKGLSDVLQSNEIEEYIAN